MHCKVLKDKLLAVKNKVEKLHDDIELQVNELDSKEEKWKELDQIAEEFLNSENKNKINGNTLVKFNVSGKKFITKVETLLSIKDTLFYKIIISEKFDLTKEIFFDRSPRFFSVILDYIRYKKIYYQRFSKEEIDDIKIEADYFEVSDISDYLCSNVKDLEIIRFEFSGPFIYSGTAVGTNNINDINDKKCLKGICTTVNGFITFELNAEWKLEGLEIGGYRGNPNSFAPENGNGANILVSVNKLHWITVGIIPSGYGSVIKTVKFNNVHSAKYIKFQHHNYLGIGYLKLIPKK